MYVPYSGKFSEENIFRNLEKTNDFQKYISEYSLFFLNLEMALLKYLTLKQSDTMNTCSECLLNASGPLVITMSSGSITAANSSVVKVLEKQQKQAETKKSRGEYLIYNYYIIRIYIYVWCRDISWQVSNNNIFSGYCNCVYIVYVR